MTKAFYCSAVSPTHQVFNQSLDNLQSPKIYFLTYKISTLGGLHLFYLKGQCTLVENPQSSLWEAWQNKLLVSRPYHPRLSPIPWLSLCLWGSTIWPQSRPECFIYPDCSGMLSCFLSISTLVLFLAWLCTFLSVPTSCTSSISLCY